MSCACSPMRPSAQHRVPARLAWEARRRPFGPEQRANTPVLGYGTGTPCNAVSGCSEGVYFQYWNGTVPAVNTASTGLPHLDAAINTRC